MRVGIFGGTFDPPHLGHLILAEEALLQLDLAQVWWVLTPTPPHKEGQDITATALREELLEAAISGNPCFSLSRVEMERPAPHYAFRTVELLREQHPQVELVYLMGGDSLVDLPAWKNPRQFVAACDEIGVMRRPGEIPDWDSLEQALPGVRAKVRFVEAPLLEISASEIRKKVRQGAAFRYYVREEVYRIIQEKQIYR